jgi:hypothetical protein
LSTGVTWTDFMSVKRLDRPVGDGGSVGVKMGVDAAHPPENRIDNIAPMNFCRYFELFISYPFCFTFAER